MTSARSYQRPKATAAARAELVANAGSQFDASIVRAFLAISLPRLLWATGPISLVAHLPYFAQLRQIGQTSIAAATQTATATAVAGVTAVSLLGPATFARGGTEPIGGNPSIAIVESSTSIGGTRLDRAHRRTRPRTRLRIAGVE